MSIVWRLNTEIPAWFMRMAGRGFDLGVNSCSCAFLQSKNFSDTSARRDLVLPTLPSVLKIYRA